MKKILILCLAMLLLFSACSLTSSDNDEPYSAAFTIRPQESLTEVFFDLTVPEGTTASGATSTTTKVFVSPATQTPAENTLRLEDLRDLMVQTMFDDGDNASAALWASQIRYTLRGSFTPDDQAVLSDMAADLVQIASFPGMRETAVDNANVTVHFADVSEASFHCERASDGTLHSGEIMIPAGVSAAERSALLQENMFRLFGFPNQAQTALNSVLSVTPASSMTEADLILLETVYGQMKPGMSKADCVQVFTQYFLPPAAN